MGSVRFVSKAYGLLLHVHVIGGTRIPSRSPMDNLMMMMSMHGANWIEIFNYIFVYPYTDIHVRVHDGHCMYNKPPTCCTNFPVVNPHTFNLLYIYMYMHVHPGGPPIIMYRLHPQGIILFRYVHVHVCTGRNGGVCVCGVCVCVRLFRHSNRGLITKGTIGSPVGKRFTHSNRGLPNKRVQNIWEVLRKC